MFEYLMPALVLRTFPSTLLNQTNHGAVRRQISYGVERGVPWGISESAYNVRDRSHTYQYRGFGVPDLALKRGLSKELVIAPYATALALTVEPHQAVRNLSALESNQPMATVDEKGERQLMEASQRDQEIERARRFMAESCK